MKAMVAKFRGVCRACGSTIYPGHKINFFGRGHAEHADCSNLETSAAAPGSSEDSRAGLEPGTLAADRRSARRGVSVFRFSSGAVVTQNSRGRCEDAPCCGCCS